MERRPNVLALELALRAGDPGASFDPEDFLESFDPEDFLVGDATRICDPIRGKGKIRGGMLPPSGSSALKNPFFGPKSFVLILAGPNPPPLSILGGTVLGSSSQEIPAKKR